jgi:hypothetical protein
VRVPTNSKAEREQAGCMLDTVPAMQLDALELIGAPKAHAHAFKKGTIFREIRAPLQSVLT